MNLPILDQAEAKARELVSKIRYQHINAGDAGVALTLLDELRKLQNRIYDLETKGQQE